LKGETGLSGRDRQLVPAPRSRSGRRSRSRSRAKQPHLSRADLNARIHATRRVNDGRWFLTTSFAVMGKPLDPEQRPESQARLLLQRYGILVKEWYRREQGLLPWYHLFQALKRLEWRGEIRRGYFVQGLSGVQFALPEALEMLEKIISSPGSKDDTPALISTMDPAVIYGGGINRDIAGPDGKPFKIVRSASNHLVLSKGQIIVIAENHFQRMFILEDLSDSMRRAVVQLLHSYLKMPYHLRPANRIEVQQINDLPAATSQYAAGLINFGFEKDGEKLILWAEV
jgi:ATP-dependent Lhr-like helicase